MPKLLIIGVGVLTLYFVVEANRDKKPIDIANDTLGVSLGFLFSQLLGKL